MKKKSLTAGIFTALIGLTTIIFLGRNAGEIIISIGIVAFKAIVLVSTAVILLGTVLFAAPIVRLLVTKNAKKKAAAKKKAEEDELIRKTREDVRGLVSCMYVLKTDQSHQRSPEQV